MNHIIYLLIILIITSLNLVTVFAEKEMIYNDMKDCWEVKDKESGEIIACINSRAHISSTNKCSDAYDNRTLSFPNQEGWPVLFPNGIEYPLNIADIDNDGKNEIAFRTKNDAKMRLYKHNGQPYPTWNDPIMGWLATFADIDSNRYKDLIATQACLGGCGAGVRDLNSTMLNGFPNPPNTAFISAAIEDIDRDGNNDIAFAPYEKTSVDGNHLGLYVLGSWGGLLPGFPVIFPWMDPGLGLPNRNYASPSFGDFDDDGLLEIAATTTPGMLYLIKADGSHFRNWPIYLENSSIGDNAPAIGDIDNDGKLEIASAISNFIYKLFAFRADASVLNGFPVETEAISYNSPSLADINQNGKLELFVANGDGKLFAINDKGENLTGWPVDATDDVPCIGFWDPPTIGDIDNDNQMELVYAGANCQGCPDGIIIAYNSDGTLVDNFPIVEIDYWSIRGVAVLTDLDNDGDIEICIHSEHCLNSEDPAYIFCYDLPYAYKKDMIAWEGYAHDPQHTGRYVNPAIEPPVVSSINPTTGSYKGGDVVQIKGQHFLPGAKVFFDGIPATNVEVADSTTLYATTPPHKPCSIYINDISISPYELSLLLAHQPTINYSALNARSLISDNNLENRTLNIEQLSGCRVNVVVVHPSPDQREGVLRAGFIYTGYEFPNDNITLMVKKYSPMGTFENNAANWAYLPHWHASNQDGLWTILDNSSNCIPKPYPSGRKVMYYGKKNDCTYDIPWQRHFAEISMPAITVDSEDAAIRFMYYRDVEYTNPYFPADEFKVSAAVSPAPYEPRTVLFMVDSATPSEKQWIQSPELPIGQWAGKQLWVYFAFDTITNFNNSTTGIALDNIELIGAHWSPWAETSGEVILSWTGGYPKYLVYRGTNPNFDSFSPELRSYAPFPYKYENSLNDDESYYYLVK